MKCEVRTTANFEKAAKPLLKKFKSLKTELHQLGGELQRNPEQGTSLGNHVFKIRLAIKSKGKGKSGGARVITFVELEVELDKSAMTVYLLTIYDKSETDTISRKEIDRLIKERDL